MTVTVTLDAPAAVALLALALAGKDAATLHAAHAIASALAAGAQESAAAVAQPALPLDGKRKAGRPRGSRTRRPAQTEIPGSAPGAAAAGKEVAQ